MAVSLNRTPNLNPHNIINRVRNPYTVMIIVAAEGQDAHRD